MIRDGGDGSWAFLRGETLADAVSSTGASIAVDEDTISNSERMHTTEQLSMVGFAPVDPCGEQPCSVDLCVPGATLPGVIDEPVYTQSEADWAQLDGAWCVTSELRKELSDVIDLGGLSSLRAVAGELSTRDNASLQSLAGLENLRAAESVRIEMNPVQDDISALSGLNQAGEMNIGQNMSLPQCEVDALATELAIPVYSMGNDEEATCL